MMAKRISNDKREAIVLHKKAGERNVDISRWLFVSQATVINVWKKYQDTGSYAPYSSNSGRKPKVSEAQMEAVVAQIKETPDITLVELIDKFNLPILPSTLCMRLKKLNFRYKKRHYIQVGKNERT